ncbi:MAG: hypothetical protein ABH834_05605, partial [Candidatus Altiarchaeota archaeon]
PFTEEVRDSSRRISVEKFMGIMDQLTPEKAGDVREFRQDAARAFIFLESAVAAQGTIFDSLQGLVDVGDELPQVCGKLFSMIGDFDDVFMAFHVNDNPLRVGGKPYRGGQFLISAGPSAGGKDDVMGKPKYTSEGDIVFAEGTALDRLCTLTVDGAPIVTPSEIARPMKVTNRKRRPHYVKDAQDRTLQVPVLMDGKLEYRTFELLGEEVTGSVEASVDITLSALKRVADSPEFQHAGSYLRDLTLDNASPDERRNLLELTGRSDSEEALSHVRALHKELSEMLYQGVEGGAHAFIQRQVEKKGSGEINGVDYWFLRPVPGKIGGRSGDFRRLENDGALDVAYTYSQAGYGFMQDNRRGLYGTYQMTYLSLKDAISHASDSMRRDPVLAEVVSRYATNGRKSTDHETIIDFITQGREIPSLRKQRHREPDGTITIAGLSELAEGGKHKLIILGSGTTPEVEVLLTRFPESELSYIIQGSKNRPIEEILHDMTRFQSLRGTEDPRKQEDRRIECGPHIRRGLNLVRDPRFNTTGYRIHVIENYFDTTPEKAQFHKTQRLGALMLAARILDYEPAAMSQILRQLSPGQIPIRDEDIEAVGIPLSSIRPGEKTD